MASPVARTRDSSQLISRVPYLPGLDGMRALAVVAVMVYHANSEWLHGGFLGVEVFFVISGYLITLLLVAEHEKDGAVSLGQFWLRRARRLLPALWLMMVLVVIYTAFWRSDELGTLRGDFLGSFFYIENWYQIWTGQGYTDAAAFAPLRHLWSLAVEEQFYLFWPLVMVAFLGLGRRRLPQIGLWLFGMSAFITVTVAALYHPGAMGECDVNPEAYFIIGERCFSKMDTLYLSTPTRMGGILLGAGLAMWWRPVALGRSRLKDKGLTFDAVAVLGLFALAGLMWVTHLKKDVTDVGTVAGRLLFQGGFMLTGLATLAVIMAVTHPGAVMGKVLGNPVFLWVGTRSYGLYLYHWPIYQIIREQAGVLMTPAQFALAMVLTVAITEVSFRWFETPIRKGAIGRAVRGLGARTQAAAIRRRRILVGGLVAAILPVFAGVQLATAELKQNDVAQSIEQGQEAVTDLDDLLGNDTTPPTGTEPTVSTEPDGTTTTEAPDQTGGSAPPTTKKPRKTTTTTEKPREKIDVYAIGDSVMLGAAPSLTERGAVVDAAVNRQGTEGRDILRQVSDAGLFGNAVVIHLGTNGSVSEQTYDEMIAATRGVNLVVVLTIRADRSWTAGNNALISALPSKHPTVKVVDWATLSNACPGDCFASDNIHLNADGADYYARLIYEALGRG